jgi:multiple sugar transport system ATP-binding protein
MASVQLINIHKAFPDGSQVIKGVDLHIADGELVVFVGPSGCGKSTLLRMIAGLEDISEGQLLIDGKVANDIAPAKRGLAMVFQSYALYPHMSVFENMAFSLKMSGQTKTQIQDAVQKAAQVLQITHLLERKPKDLSGGQRQRVAIGRAIVRQPTLFLFDEPLSNLDASLRVQMRIELSRLHQELKTTMIYVTHDQVEAMTLGQRIVVFNVGKIEQVGTPLELYEKPANMFVASFLGSPKMNFMKAKVVRNSEQKNQVQLESGELFSLNIDVRHLKNGEEVNIACRAEHVQIVEPKKNEQALENTVQVRCQMLERLGDSTLVYGQAENKNAIENAIEKTAQEDMLTCKLVGTQSSALAVHQGDGLTMLWPPEHCLLFDGDGRAVRNKKRIYNLI